MNHTLQPISKNFEPQELYKVRYRSTNETLCHPQHHWEKLVSLTEVKIIPLKSLENRGIFEDLTESANCCFEEFNTTMFPDFVPKTG
jgi:hypothetical protein